MEFKIKLKDPGPSFNIDLGSIYIFRWDGEAWILIGEIRIQS
jgi:hypothetical protein